HHAVSRGGGDPSPALAHPICSLRGRGKHAARARRWGRAHHGEILVQASRLVEAGALVPLVDPRRFSLASVESAHNSLRNRDAQGKTFVDLGGAAHDETFLYVLEGR